jgi:cytochrome c biogenesis protein CcmG, thiol:disulfide interchange protein DsbE
MTRNVKVVAQAVAVAGVVALAVVLGWRLTHQSSPPKIGGPAPTFALQRLDATGTLSLASLRGKAVVLNFWASWCGPCKAEAPALEKLWRQYRGRGVVFVGVDSNDASSDARRFLAAHRITYPVVSDKNGLVAANRYDVAVLPVTYFVNRRGHLVATHIAGGVNEYTSEFENALAVAMRP